MTIYELLAQRQSELENRESELLTVVKELEGVQQELADIRQMTNIRLLSPSTDDLEPGKTAEPATEVEEISESEKTTDISDLLLLKQDWESKYGS